MLGGVQVYLGGKGVPWWVYHGRIPREVYIPDYASLLHLLARSMGLHGPCDGVENGNNRVKQGELGIFLNIPD